MRNARIKPLTATPEGTYYHLVNRVSGSPTDYPFGEIEKLQPNIFAIPFAFCSNPGQSV